MNTTITNILKNDIHIVGIQNTEKEYMLWQKTENENEIHFEWNNQKNSGYDIVKECTVDKDGIHIVLKNSKMLHFYFLNCSDPDWQNFSIGLKEIYAKETSILLIYE